jgi:hypothetical protein
MPSKGPVKGMGRNVVGAVRARLGSSTVAGLERRVEELEAEVQECRAVNLRVAELVDVVTELLVPLARGEDEKVQELLERYHGSL